MSDPNKKYLNYFYQDEAFTKLLDRLKKAFDTSTTPKVFELKKIAYDFFSVFFESLRLNSNIKTSELPLRDQLKLQKIEHYLVSNLYSKFVGIDFLSKKFKISPTKLKESFKLLYGKPIFQYFQDQKMELALTYVKSKDLKIKDIAQKFDYENTSKFSRAFQKYHDKLPSKIDS